MLEHYDRNLLDRVELRTHRDSGAVAEQLQLRRGPGHIVMMYEEEWNRTVGRHAGPGLPPLVTREPYVAEAVYLGTH